MTDLLQKLQNVGLMMIFIFKSYRKEFAMTTKYKYIICTYACPLAFVSAAGEITCIHYLPMESEHVFPKPRNVAIADHANGSPATRDLFPIIAWQPWYRAPAASNGVICLAPAGSGSDEEPQ